MMEKVPGVAAPPARRPLPGDLPRREVCKVRVNGTVGNRSAHLVVGVNADGKKKVLGIGVEATEGAKFWTRVMGELKARGVFRRTFEPLTKRSFGREDTVCFVTWPGLPLPTQPVIGDDDRHTRDLTPHGPSH
jgi:hypothetical protein